MLTGNPMTTDEVFAKLDAVTADDIHAVAYEIIKPASLNLAMIGPWKDETVFQKIITEW